MLVGDEEQRGLLEFTFKVLTLKEPKIHLLELFTPQDNELTTVVHNQFVLYS